MRGLAEVLRIHARNEVIEPGPGGDRGEVDEDWPQRTRVKCQGDSCDFHGVYETWYAAVDAHAAHVAEAVTAWLGSDEVVV